MKFTSKSKFRAIAVLFLALAVTVSCALWSVFGRRGNGMEALANTTAAEIANALNGAAADWKTQTSVRVGDTSKSDEDGKGDDGCVVTISQATAGVDSVEIPSGAQVTVDPIAPSVQRELENIATYTQIIFEVPVTVQAEAVLTLNADVVFCDEVTVEGTLIINGMAFNQGAMRVSNANNTHAEIKSEGVIVNGSLNNDAARGGSISIAAGATLTIGSGSGTEYADGTAAPDGGALFLKADTSNKLGITNQGTLSNGGSVIYDENAGAPSVSGEGVVQSAEFINEIPANNTNISKTYVFYLPENVPEIAGIEGYCDGTSLALSNDSTKTWSNITLLSFGRTVITNTKNDSSYTLSNVSLGGGTSGGTFTQGANELIFDGGARWVKTGNQDEARQEVYNLNGGWDNRNQSRSVEDLRFFNGGEKGENYTNGSDGVYSSSPLMRISGSNVNLSVFGGVRLMHHETRDANGVGGAISVKKDAKLALYGGDISYNAVTRSGNAGTGAGIYVGNASASIYGGKISYNAIATYISARIGGLLEGYSKKWLASGSADGAGIAVDPLYENDEEYKELGSELNLYGGEISYNHGATGSTADPGADGGGLIARYSVVNMFDGKIQGNYAGGSGGGILLWDSELNMSGGSIANNRAAFGGGVGMTSDNVPKKSEVNISGGEIFENEAFYNNYINAGGYGGGICVGSSQYQYNSSATFSGSAVVFGNEAVYGGGLAVYTGNSDSFNYLEMSGGTVTGNTASANENGNGVYVTCSEAFEKSGGMLRLSGSASIDSSNNVSFEIPTRSTTAPISVTGELTGSALAALVRLSNEGAWANKNIVSFANENIVNRDKFLLDSTRYAFSRSSTSLTIGTLSASDPVARVGNAQSGQGYTTLEDAVKSATDGQTIYILRGSMISRPIEINKNLTIEPYGGNYTLAVATGFDRTGYNNPAVFIINGGSLTLGNESGNRLIIDGNGTVSNGISLISVISGSYTQNAMVTLRNCNTTANGGAIFLNNAGASATIRGGIIENTIGAGGAIYVGNGASLTMTGGELRNNTDRDGNSYGIYLSNSQSVLTLNGAVTLSDDIYTEAVITVDNGFAVTEGQKIGIATRSDWRAGQPLVDGTKYVTSADMLESLLNAFELVNMGKDYSLVAQSSDTSKTLVLSKAVTYIFDYGYEDGAEQQNAVKPSYGDFDETIFDQLGQYNNGAFASRISTRGNRVVITVPWNSGTFDLSSLSLTNYATLTGHSIIRWQTADGGYNYNEGIGYTESSAEINVYAVWAENTYEITFDKNASAITGASSSDVKGEMGSQEIVYPEANEDEWTGNIDVNRFTAVGWKFSGWKNVADSSGTVFEDHAALTGAELLALASGTPSRYEIQDGVVSSAVYTVTLQAQWESIFGEGSGVGTSEGNAFLLNSVNDLYILEATVFGPEADRNGKGEYSILNGYYNDNDESGAPDYTAEDYEGYYFRLGGDIGNADTPFTGVIGRVSTDPVVGGSHAGDDAQNHLDQEDQITNAVYGDSATSGGSGAAAGTPFKGTFDGGGHTIYLNINKQKTTAGNAGATIKSDEYGTYTNGDETLTGVGLFGYIDHASIKNLELAGAVHGYSHVGALVGYAFGGTIEEVYNKATVTSGGHDVGGVIGTFYELYDSYTRSSVTNAANAGEVKYAPRENGDKSKKLDVEENWDELEIIDDAEGVRFGGIVGAGITLRLTGGYNAGNITARYGVGGVVGTLRSLDDRTANDAFITQSFNIGKVTATSGLYAVSKWTTGSKETLSQTFITAYTGGITGRLVGVSTVSNSFNGGTVTADFVAQITADTVSQESGYTVARAPEVGSTDSGTYLGARGVGGIVGFTSYKKGDSAGRIALSNVYNTGSVSAWAGVGGIAGYFAYANINEAFNGGNVTATGTHYDESASARVAGGYTVGNDSRAVYVSYLGAIVGRGVSATLGATVSYNVNSSYKGYTDATVQAIGDSSYNADFGFTVNTDSAAGLTSAQMRVYEDHVLPSGFSQGFNTSGWDFLCYTPSEEDPTGGDSYSYYPQLSTFTGSKLEWTFSVTGSGQLTISKISRHYARIMYTEEGGEDKPIEDNIEFRLTFVLGGGTFAFDGEGEGNSFEGGSKIYTQVESNSDRYYYEFYYPQDGGSTELETPKAPERVGYTFGGWYIDSTYTQEFDFGAIPGQNMVIYARWVPVSYRIDYLNVNDVGGSISGDYTNSFTVENAASGQIGFPDAENMFRRGYRFVEWQFGGEGNRQKVTSADVITSGVTAPTLRLYNGDKTVKDILFSELNNQTLYLYAVWAERTYNITYYLDEEAYSKGTALSDVPEGFDKYTFGSQAFVLWSGETLNAQNLGYIFNGWEIADFDDTDAQNNKNYKVGEQRSYLESGTVGDFVLVGNWTAVKYTLTFNLGIGSITQKTASKYGLTSNLGLYSLTLGYEQSLVDGDKKWSEFKPNPPTGYTFEGWHTGVNGTGKLVELGDDSFKMPAADTTLYAHYTLNTYTVTVQIPKTVGTEVTVSIDGDKLADYDFAEGTHTDLQYVYTLQVSHGNGVEEALSALAAALQFGAPGWHFTNWTVAWTDKEDENTPSIYRVTDDLTVTANCDAEDIFINFVNQITGATIDDPVKINAGGSVPLSSIPSNKSQFGYKFSHWLYDGKKYTTDELLTEVTFTVSSTVYAVFEAAKVDATFYLDDAGKGTTISEKYTFGERFGSFPTVSELKVEGTLGYEVVNWYVRITNEDGVSSEYLVSADTPLTEDLVTKAGETYSVVLRADIELYEYTVTVNSGAGGSVSGYTGTSYLYNYDDSGNAEVNFEFPVGYSASPNTGYELAGYLVNGGMVSCTDANAATAIAAYLLTKKITGNITITAQWKLKKYAVWFDAGEDGHFVVDENKPEGVTFYNDEDATTEVENGEARYAVIIVEHNSPPDFDIVPERPGSSFSGWDYGGAFNITSERSPAIGNAITAYWTTEKYSIRYELDGGEPLSGNYETFYQYGEVINFTASPYVPRRGGYSFLGWFDQAEDGKEIKSTEGMTGDLTLYAHWEVNTYALQLTISLPQGVEKATIVGWFSAVKGISFIAEDIDIVDNSITVWVYANYGTSLTALNSVLKTIGNYVPKGWEYEGSAYYFSTMPESGTPLEFDEDDAPVNIEESGGMQLTNSYVSQENYHTITVYLTPDKKTVYTILYVPLGSETVAPVDPTRTGYTFSKKWMQANAGGEDTEFEFGSSLTADIEIYAEWTPNKYTVTFNGNGATSGSMGVQDFVYDVEQALTQNEFSRTGYTFIGWATTPDGNVKDPYEDQETVSNLTADENGKVTLYAVWEANTYKIAFHYGNTSVKEGDLSNYGKEPEEYSFAYGANISFADAAIPHYSHVWYMWMSEHDAVLFRDTTMPDLSDKRYEGYVTVGTGEEKYTYTIHLYAVYTAETYYIRYQSGESTPVNVTMVTETKLNSAEPSLGYAFVGWELYTNGDSVSGENYFNFFAVEVGAVVFRTQSDDGNTHPVPLGDLESYTLVPHFEAIKYTIEFVGGDGATGSTASMSLSYGTTGILQENKYEKNGYNFAGWALSDNTDSVAYADGASITITSGLVEGLGEGKTTITLYAVWTPIEYTITYVLNGGSLNGNPDLTYTIEESVTLASPAARTGYKFGGWYEKEDFSGDAVSEIAKGSTGNKVFYAKWKPESCAVRFAENSGTGLNLSAENALYGQQFVLTLTAQEGYTLPASVEVKMDGGVGDFYSYSNGVITISSVTGAITITANGVINRYTVTFNSNGGSAVGNQTIEHNGKASEPVVDPTRTGYTFVGWFKDGIETPFNFSTPITENLTLTAKWKAIQYTVTFDANGGEGSLDAQTFTYDVAKELTKNNNSIHRTGYTFLGWATEKDSNSVAYSDGASVINLASTNNKTVELFAVWQINTYTLTFELTLPKEATTDVVSDRMDQLVKLTLNDDIRKDVTLGGNAETGYTITVTITAAYKISLTDFINLLLQDSKFKEFVVEGITYTLTIPESGLPSTMPAESKEYSGSWTSDNVRTLIVYSDNGVLYATYYTTTDTVTINPDRPIKAGYTFNGWTASGGRLEGSTFTFAENGKTATLTAQWNSVTYTVQYAGEEAPSSPMEFTFDGENFKLEDGSIAELPSGLDRKGYTFGGWLYNDAVYTTLAELFEKTSLGDGYDASTTVIDLTAVWKPIEYTVMFNANGGMGAVNSQTITIDDADGISLNANSFVYVGYDFQGWATSAQGEVVYSDGGNFTLNDGLIPAEGTIITLYAVWSVKVYTLSFDKNAATDGVTGNLDSQTAIYEAVESNKTPAYFTLPEELTRKGYTFLGWATEEGSNSAVYAGGAMVNANQLFTGLEGEGDRSRTLYAVWQVNIYTVTYELNGGTEGTDWIKSYTVKYKDGTFSLPQDATREGYTFEGWFSDAQFTGDKIASFSVSDAENKIFYAKWAAEKHTVTIDLGREGSIAELPDGAEGTEGSSGAWTKFTIKMDHDSNVYDLLDKLTVAVLGSPYQLHAGWQVTVGEGNLIALQGDITVSALYSQEQIIVTVVHADGSVSHVNVKYGETLEETDVFAPKTGYNYAGWYYGENVEFVFAGKGEATVITAPITLYPNATAETYDVTTSTENAVLVGGGNDVARYGQNYVFTFIAETGYSLSDIVLKMGERSLTEEEYSYDPTTGRVVIFSVTGNIEVSATVSARTYTVTFNANGGTLTGAERADVTFGQQIGEPTEPTPPDGYTFAGWYYNGTAWDFETNTMPAGDITLVAQWERESYSVVFDNDGMKTEYTYLYGDMVTKPADPVKEGHAFLGWYNGEIPYDFAEKVTSDLTLTAMWQKNTYTVTFNANGGTDVAPQEVEYLGTAKEPAAPAREGYTFEGWYLNGTQWDFDEMSVTGDITLVALWSEIRYTVRFLDGDQLVAALTVTEKGTVTAPALGAREGYTFEGWFNGETRFDFDAPVTDDVTLTAKWSAAEYTVSFETGGGTAVSDQTVVHGGKISVPQIPEREGYVFTGWYFNGTAWDFEEMTVSGGMTLVAGWKAKEYTVTFDPNGGSAVAEQSVVYNGTATMPEQPVREGYVFEGWFSGETQFDFAAAITGDVTLTAKWSPRGYSISYVLGGGTNAAGNPSGYTVESDTITLGAPTREGYTFAGWYDAEENGSLVTQIAAGSKGNITLYAAWQANSFEVDFVANGGTLDGADTQKVTAGGTVAYAEPVRENYLFVGWFTDEALTVRYDFKTPVTGSLTLYAKWRLQVVTGVTENGTVVTVSSDAGFDDGTQLHFVEVTDEDTVGSAAAHLRDNMTLARLFDIEIVDAGGAPVEITEPLSVGISVEGLSEAEGNWGVVYVPDGEGEIEVLATHVGDDGRLYFFVEHFSFYAVVDIAEIGAGFAWWWILVAVAGCALIALILVLVARSAHRYELNFVNGGVPAQKLKESSLIDLPLPEREEEAFEGWYFDEDFRDRATLTSMPKQNLILFAKWRKLTDEERAARDRARAEAAAMAEEGFHHAAPKQEKKHKENPLSEIKEDD